MSPSAAHGRRRALQGGMAVSLAMLALFWLLWFTRLGLHRPEGSSSLPCSPAAEKCPAAPALGQHQPGEARQLAAELQATQQALQRVEQELQQKASQLEEGERTLRTVWDRCNSLLDSYSASVYHNSLTLRRYLATHSQQLQAAWAAQLAGQRQRGIVIAAGGNYSVPLTNAFVTLYVIRHHLNNSLPAAVMYWGPVEPISAELQTFFQAHLTDVEFVDASTLPYPEHHRPFSQFNGWAFKALALYAAPFQEVLFLDSDSHPVRDPSALFFTEEYQRHGNLFWPDCIAGDKPALGLLVSPIYKLFKLKSPWGARDPQLRQTDSAQLLMDRRRHWEVLEWLLFVNANNELVYRLTYGDKETFRLAFYLASKADEFQQVHHYPAFLLSGARVKSYLHFHPNGSLWIHHRTPTKFAHGQPAPDRPSTHVTARTASGSCNMIISHLAASLETVTAQMVYVSRDTCNYSLENWPAAEHECVPWYSLDARGGSQRLPVFELPQDPHLQLAEGVAYQGFQKLEAEGPH